MLSGANKVEQVYMDSKNTKKSKKKGAKQGENIKLGISNWNTTDVDEIARRRLRGETEKFHVKNVDVTPPYFSTFLVSSQQDRQYCIEICSLSSNINSCSCPDYCTNGLGTCKHIEHVLFRLKKVGVRLFKHAASQGSSRVEIFWDVHKSAVCVAWPKIANPKIRTCIEPFFSNDGTLLGHPTTAYTALCAVVSSLPQQKVRISRSIDYFIEHQKRLLHKQSAKEVFLNDVACGKKNLNVTKYPLYPYQQDGMLHLAFNERALLADEMGLGKTVQAIAASELLRQHRNIKRVLVVATASLKAEWEEQIAKFIDLPTIVVQGPRAYRLRQYQKSAFFYLTNYEQVIVDGADIQRLLAPDVIILDEAQRIKNWHTKTAIAIKQLKSRYAFVLTGTPLENRIDDIYSIVQFLDPHLFGPLFQFNRDFYELDEHGKPVGYRNLDELHKRLLPIMLRRRKSDVEGQLPKRTINNYFVGMNDEQNKRYGEYKLKIARLLLQLKRRPARKEDYENLQRWLSCMRMICDTPYILDPDCRCSPKLNELTNILEELLTDPTTKILVFSEWERMLQLVHEHTQKKRLDVAWHTGLVPQHKRRENIKRFKEDPECRLFLSTDSGSVGLNLQNANIVINLDLPWNPAKLEQRIARAWRKYQTRPVQVINLVSEDTIEHRMLSVLAQKQELAKSVLEGEGGLKEMKLPSGRNAFIKRVESLMEPMSDVDPTQIKSISHATKSQTDKSNSLHNVCNTLLAGMKDNIDLLQAHHNQESNQYTVLAVVNNPDEGQKKIQQKMQQHVQNSYGHNATPVILETLDSQTFATIQRLAKSGILTINIPTEVLHTSPSFSTTKDEVKEKQVMQARKHLELAERKQRMAQLLADGDFYEETVAPLRESFELTLRAFAWLHGREVEENTNNFIQETLVEQYGLPQSASQIFYQLNSAKNEGNAKTSELIINTAQVKKLLTTQQEIFNHVAKNLANF